MESRITQTESAISSKVSAGDIGTLIEQNANSVKIAWNKNSNFIEFENSQIKIKQDYTSNGQTKYRTLMELHKDGMKIYDTNSKLLMLQDSSGSSYYRNGNYVGEIGTTAWSNYPEYRGLRFTLAKDAGYMCWSAIDPTDGKNYVRLVYHHQDNFEDAPNGPGLYLASAMYTRGNLYLTDTEKIHTYTDGSICYEGKTKWNGPMNWRYYNGTGYTISCSIENKEIYVGYDLSIKVHSDVDMCGHSILNQSDVRLKTNIQDTQVSALDVINQIKLKEFDWIESGEHEDIGMIAQQLQTILPDLVFEDKKTGKLSIKTTKFIPYLIKSIQELTEYITGGMSTFSLRNGWTDTYTDVEKIAFIKSINTDITSEFEEEITPQPIVLPS